MSAIESMLTHVCTINRIDQTITDQELTRGADTELATNVPCRISANRSAEEASILGISSRELYVGLFLHDQDIAVGDEVIRTDALATVGDDHDRDIYQVKTKVEPMRTASGPTYWECSLHRKKVG